VFLNEGNTEVIEESSICRHVISRFQVSSLTDFGQTQENDFSILNHASLISILDQGIGECLQDESVNGLTVFSL
jgi:hypothetical protein